MRELVRYKMIFNGRVQGVGFRYKASYIADKYRLTGYVKNEYDGFHGSTGDGAGNLYANKRTCK